ncbi:MAG: malonyl-CoA decarboxylase, partial [Alphaproteobacteria bacterium]|nr:malonyl-CoA decarboxylase [Alphaproteobacteria bacterium]
MAHYQPSGLFGRLGTFWRGLVTSGESEGGIFSPDLSDSDLVQLRSHMQACLDGRGGDISARTRTALLGNLYLRLNPEGRRRFLTLMAVEFCPDRHQVDQA